MGKNDGPESGLVGNVNTVPVGNGADDDDPPRIERKSATTFASSYSSDTGAARKLSGCHDDSPQAASSRCFARLQHNDDTMDEERGRRCGGYNRSNEELTWTLSNMENNLNVLNTVLAESGEDAFTDIQVVYIIDFLRTFFIPKWNQANATYKRNHSFHRYTSLLQVTLNLFSIVLSALMQTFANSTGEKELSIRATAMIVTVNSVVHSLISAVHGLFPHDKTARKHLIERVELERAWQALVLGEIQQFEITGKTQCYNFWLDDRGCKVKPFKAFRSFAVACSGAASVGTDAVLSGRVEFLLSEERKPLAQRSINPEQGRHTDTAPSR